jgi:hypothetical protein
MLGQGGKDIHRLAAEHRPAKLGIHHQPVDTVLQVATAQVQQPFEYPGADLQLQLRLALHRLGSGGLDREIHRGNQYQQQ